MAGDRHRSHILCVWPKFPHECRTLYQKMRFILFPDELNLVVKVADVRQCDGRIRFDIYIDNRSDQASRIGTKLEQGFPDKWVVRPHIPYHLRRTDSDHEMGNNRADTRLATTLSICTWNVRSFWGKRESLLQLCQEKEFSVMAI